MNKELKVPLKILFVEDDKIDLSAFTRMVSKKNLPYEYAIAKSVSDSVTLLQQRQFDIVLIDYMLGDGTALDVLKFIPPDTPSIIVTGVGSEEIAVEALRAGANDYLIKDDRRAYLNLLPVVVDRVIRIKQAEKEILTLAQAVRSSQDSIFITDQANRITAVNQAFQDTYHYNDQEIIGRTCFELYADDNMPSELEEVIDQECVHLRKGGERFHISISRSNIIDNQGITFARVFIARDITERKKTQEALQRSEARLMEAERISHSGSWELDLRSNHLFWSDEIYRIFDINPSEFSASYEAFLDAIHPEDREFVNHAYTESVETKIPYDITHRLLMKDGRIKYVREYCETFYDQQDQPIRSIGVVQDITEQKELEAQRLQSIAEQERIKVLQRFINDASHDLRTPLTIIKMSLYSLKRELGGQFTRQTDKLEKNTQRLIQLVADMLQMSKLDSLEEVTSNRVEVGRLVGDAVDQHQPTVAEKQQTLHFDRGSQPVYMMMDADLILNAVSNIITNALNYTPDGGEITVRILEDHDQVIIEVQDTGIGIDETHIEQIFERFYRVDKARGTVLGGTGLGLALVKRIAELHNGRVTVQSTVGQGSIFRILLPIVSESGLPL
jgi:PAS domain S-box-containing protein